MRSNMYNLHPSNMNESTNDISENQKEYLEFSLSGNDTTLVVREVSIDDVTWPNKDERNVQKSIKGLHEVPKSLETVSSKHVSEPVVQPVKNVTKSSSDNRASHTRALKALSTKKWSGNTYFEEEIRRLRDKQYEKEKKLALERRKMWKAFQKEILKDERRELVKSNGPEWWQEPSPKQIVLASTLKNVIVADFEEEVTGRTRQWLLDLGVTTRLTPKQVRSCMKRSLLEPVDFLLETHVQIVKSQIEVKKKGQLQRPFSVDERLLLSAVCVLQLPTLFTMLHYVLPPPKPVPLDKHVQELIYGDLDDTDIRYFSPYMEPLPSHNKIYFENWAFQKICSAFLPILLQNSQTSNKVSDVSEQITSELKMSLNLENCNNRLSKKSSTPTIPLLLSHCLSKRKLTDSLKVNFDKDSLRRKNFGRRLTIAGKSKSQKAQIEEKRTMPRKAMDNEASTTSTESILMTQSGVEDLQSFETDREDVASLQTLQHVLEEIQDLPVKEHLPKAIKVLAEMGDPLAQLPKIEKLPTIQRWLEVRRGTNIVNTQKTKAQLLNVSRGMWKSVKLKSSTKGPKVQISKWEERKLTWADKKWLDSEVKKETKIYDTRIKLEKVDNARAFFPTMLNHYDYGSNLNRRFREIYFTYLPAREADTYVRRPWKPQETRNHKK